MSASETGDAPRPPWPALGLFGALLALALAGHVMAAEREGYVLTPEEVEAYTVRSGRPAKTGATPAEATEIAPFLATVAAAATGQPAMAMLDVPPWSPQRCREWIPAMRAAGQRHGVPVSLLHAAAIAESGCQATRADGTPVRSPSGAQGMFQIMPATGAEIARRHGIGGHPDDPLVGIEMGAAYFGEQLRRFGEPWLAAAAYNGGPTATACYLQGGTWVYLRYGSYCNYAEGPGFRAETRRYIRWVGGMHEEWHEPVSPTFCEWCRAGSCFNLPEKEDCL